MGYSTHFVGRFRISPPLTAAQSAYLRAFANTRRVTRNPRVLGIAPDPLREAIGLPVGPEGCYFVGVAPMRSRSAVSRPRSLVDGNRPPAGQPSLWCDWEPDSRGAFLEWNEADKFYNYVEWLEYLVEHFFRPWNRVLTGDVRWQGDDDTDVGTIIVKDNDVDVLGPIVVRHRNIARRLRVFLCYASEDGSRVRVLARRLRDDNIDVWLDDSRLLPGTHWTLEIGKALRSSDAVVLCLSPASVRKRGFVQKEVRLALSVADEEPEGELFLFPVRLSPCEVPDSLRHLQRLDLRRRGGYARLMAGLAARAASLTERR